MSVLLHIDSSPLGSASISRHLSSEFVQRWQEAHPGGEVITRDLAVSPLPAIDANWIGASFTPPEARTSDQRNALVLSDILIAELRAADEYVIGLPMHNFTVPSSLRLWIDQIARAGETFSYTEGGPVGLLLNKKATFIISSGGVYDAGTPMASLNLIEPYLRAVFGFMGITEPRFHWAGGAAAVAQGKVDRQEFLQSHAGEIGALAA